MFKFKVGDKVSYKNATGYIVEIDEEKIIIDLFHPVKYKKTIKASHDWKLKKV